jgi:hypothetical protein
MSGFFSAMFDKVGNLLVSGAITASVLPVGAPSQSNGQLAPTAVASTAMVARATRRTVTFVNSGTVPVFIGPATVTAAAGASIAPGAARTVT